MKLGRLGVWYSTDKHKDAAAIAAFVKTVERLGYDTLWYPEARGFESFTVAGYMLSQTSKLKLGSSIASIYARDAFTSRRGMISLNQLYGDRFILGLGVSHVPMVEGLRGHVYEKPVPAMRAYLNGIIKGRGGCSRFPALHCRAGSIDAETRRTDDPRRAAVQHDPEAYGGSGEDPRARTNGWRSSRKLRLKPTRQGSSAWPRGTVSLHGAG